jgi:hypothetical protein
MGDVLFASHEWMALIMILAGLGIFALLGLLGHH